MKQRVITGVLGAVAFLVFLWIGSWWYTGMLGVIATIAYIEYCQMIHLRWKQPPVVLGLFVVWLIILSNLFVQLQPTSLPYLQEPNSVLLGLIAFFLSMIFSRNTCDIHQLAFLFVGSLYIGYGFSYMIQLIWEPHGFAWSLFIILVIWASDTGAFFIGKRFGKKKLCPTVSPNKTVEGALGGVGFALMASLILYFFFPHFDNILYLLLIGILISIFGQIGDLVESAIKRATGLKDTGRILPGHGGILDRFDSLVFALIFLSVLNLP